MPTWSFGGLILDRPINITQTNHGINYVNVLSSLSMKALCFGSDIVNFCLCYCKLLILLSQKIECKRFFILVRFYCALTTLKTAEPFFLSQMKPKSTLKTGNFLKW